MGFGIEVEREPLAISAEIPSSGVVVRDVPSSKPLAVQGRAFPADTRVVPGECNLDGALRLTDLRTRPCYRAFMALFQFVKRRGFPFITGAYALESYASPYWNAARQLVEAGAFKGEGRPDFSVFPIVYLYRHALELMVKSILVEHGHRAELPSRSALEQGHRLTSMPEQLLRVVDGFGRYADGRPVIAAREADWKELQAVVREWSVHDPDSIAFRYGVKKDAATTLIDHDFTFDLIGFARTMDYVLAFLSEIKDDMDSIVVQEIASENQPPDQA